MKRIIKISLLCAVMLCPLLIQAGLPSSWGRNVNDQSWQRESKELENFSSSNLSNAHLMYSVLPRFLEGKPVRIYVDISALEDQSDGNQQYFEKKVKNLYAKWFENALKYTSKRPKEFGEFNQLAKKWEIIFAKRSNREPEIPRTVDVRFVIYPNETIVQNNFPKEVTSDQIKRIIGSYTPGWVGGAIKVKVSLTEGDGSWLHEIGHTFGLADEYQQENTSPKYRSAKLQPNSVMERQNAAINEPTCHDAEGLVNMIDAWQIQIAIEDNKLHGDWKKHVDPRVLRGWKGFGCGDDEFYLLGSSLKELRKQKDLSREESFYVEKAYRKLIKDVQKNLSNPKSKK